ncbi:Maf-like protein [Flavobacterium capsici]|uniref:dTTP/UTP pyrophosphatase n=1 Tax=Flavobacterium capsici TaxID=3075618 RepID=A0AA96F1A9_9FLAO|nr:MULTISPECIES: Maf-like protein [unclassified Flavobacterium]WNM18227.1 Maf-like protein [Flavobacterium sp. PMR2A8]WNM22278.1 Maf-like protein [Flavobacterium sp. PMTSA4]
MLKDKLKNYKLILASGSPRRQQFFKDLGLDFEIKIKNVDEIYPNHLQGVEITNFLAELKASSFDNEMLENEIVITSDTIVWYENRALGKPNDYDEAFAMLKNMAGNTHEVITSVCFKTSKKNDLLHCVTKVSFNNLTDEEINYYLDKYKPFDKAGAYGIQEWIGLIGISRIEGSYTNVVGMPTEMVFTYLKNLNI